MEYSGYNSTFGYAGGPSPAEPLHQPFYEHAAEQSWLPHQATSEPFYYRQYASHDPIDVSIQVSDVRTRAHAPAGEHSTFDAADIGGISQFTNDPSMSRVSARHRPPTDQLAVVRQLPFTEHQRVRPAPYRHHNPQVGMQQHPQPLVHHAGVSQYNRRTSTGSTMLPTVARPSGAATQGVYDARPATSSSSSSLAHGRAPSTHVSLYTVHADPVPAAAMSPSNHLPSTIGPPTFNRRSIDGRHLYTHELETQYLHPPTAATASVQHNTPPAPDVPAQPVASTPPQLDPPGHELRYQLDPNTSHYVPSVIQVAAAESPAAPTPSSAAVSPVVQVYPEELPPPLEPPIVEATPVFSVGAPMDPGKKGRSMHPCSLCHKSFDRPSTLRIHRRVHTLEKNYQCTKCERRFSVESNLKRHAKSCGITKARSPAGQSAESDEERDASSDDETRTPKLKRPRRKNTAPRWLPASLQGYKIGTTDRAPMPLPPLPPPDLPPNADPLTVAASLRAAQMEFDPYPYAERNWTGVFPGPALKPIQYKMEKTC